MVLGFYVYRNINGHPYVGEHLYVCVNSSQLCGVLGNALGQSVQPSVAASHNAV